MFQNIKAVAADFDGNLADTAVPNNKGMGVKEAYYEALKTIFGAASVQLWWQKEGFTNQAPSELLEAFLAYQPGKRSYLIDLAKRFFSMNHLGLGKGLVPEGKGIPLIWDDESPARVITEMIVRIKLRCLVGCISSTWPRPFSGADKFLAKLAPRYPFAILSSGHDIFIQKTFTVWGLNPPGTMLTDDDLRIRPGDPSEWVKPSASLVPILERRWRLADERVAELPRSSILYIGDDPVRDGGQADAAGWQFALFDPTGARRHERPFGFAFSAWEELTLQLP